MAMPVTCGTSMSHDHVGEDLLNEEGKQALNNIQARHERVKSYDEVIGDFTKLLWHNVIAEYAKIIENATPEQARVIKVAKAICVASGYDVDLVVMGHPGSAGPMLGAKHTAVITAPIQPQWAVFYLDALAALEAVDAIKETS
jgi:hypothetical protein